MNPNDLVIILEGGLVHSVSLKNRYLRNKLGQAVIVDLDTEDACLTEITLIRLPDGTDTEAIINHQNLTKETPCELKIPLK